MIITALIENTACREDIAAAHGLGLYIETPKHRILFDAGPSGDKLLKNSARLGIDLGTVDIAVLSHGHYDHSGGLFDFLSINTKAVLYMNVHAPECHVAGTGSDFRDIGISRNILERFGDRIAFTDGYYEIDDSLSLFSDIKSRRLLSSSGASLLEKCAEGAYVPDSFKHEQSLIIKENGRSVLISGCAHRGIVNIIERFSEIIGNEPDLVVSGFHLTNPGAGTDEPIELIMDVAEELVRKNTKYYSCHCTGINPFKHMKSVLGNKLQYLSAGDTIEF